MAKVFRNNLGGFTLVLFLIIFSFVSFYFLKNSFTKAQEQIKIFPTVFSGDWQNAEAALFQNVGPSGNFEAFNKGNSAHPFLQEQTPAEEIIVPPEEIIEEPATTSEEIATPTEEIIPPPEEPGTSTETTETATTTEEIATATEEIIAPTEEAATTNEDVATSTEETTTETTTEAGPVSFWHKIKNFFSSLGGFEASAQEEFQQSFLILSDFSLPQIENTEIKIAQLRMSLAGRGTTDDKLIIDYYYQGSWRGLTEINLGNEISNGLNGDFFLYGLPIFENWQDLTNLKIRFNFQTSSHNSSQIYLDALWLEIETEEIKKAETQTDERFILKSVKNNWQRNEEPDFEFQEIAQQNKGLLSKISSFFGFNKKEISAVLINPRGEVTSDGVFIQDNKIKISQSNKRSFKPGLYKLKVKMTEGSEEFEKEQDFTWGVLAINTNKSIYLPQERAYLQMAALKDDGHTICDASLKLEIINPRGEKNSPVVQKSGECGLDNVTAEPDYFSYYQIHDTGIYKMTLTNLDSGNRIEDFFEVRDSIPFDIERIGPTRIYPPADYKVILKIKANQDFKGHIVETVPESFEISTENVKYGIAGGTPDILSASLTIENSGNYEKKLIWRNINLKKGDELKLEYTFDAPDISPYLYLLGPLEFHD